MIFAMPNAPGERRPTEREPLCPLSTLVGCHDNEDVISLRQRVVNVMQSECRVSKKGGFLRLTNRTKKPLGEGALAYGGRQNTSGQPDTTNGCNHTAVDGTFIPAPAAPA